VRGENLNTIEYRAFVAYENKDYHKAINLFNSVKSPNETYILFYKAMCYLSIDKASKAINILETLSLLSNQDEDNQRLSNKAYWYLGLAYLKTDDKKGAISNFLIVRDQPCNECKKSKRSENLLKHLK
jgi:tetratricopeptide (TPR) repeat protein